MPTKTKTSRSHASKFQFPAQLILGIIFSFSGSLFLLKQVGKDYLPFIPDKILVYICAIGSLLGGIHLIISKIWKPRVYLY